MITPSRVGSAGGSSAYALAPMATAQSHSKLAPPSWDSSTPKFVETTRCRASSASTVIALATGPRPRWALALAGASVRRTATPGPSDRDTGGVLPRRPCRYAAPR